MYHRRRTINLLIAALLLLLLNYPLLSVTEHAGSIGGIPALYLFLGSVWIGSIVLLYISGRKGAGSKNTGDE